MSEPHAPQPDAQSDAGHEVPPAATRTGEPRVDEALQGVAGLDDVPVDEHADRLTAAHGALQEVLRQPSEPHP